MTTLTATAIITAVDRASAVFGRVAAAAQAAAGRFQAAAVGAHNAGAIISTGVGIGAAAGFVALINRTQEFQKTLAGIEIAGIADNLQNGVVNFQKLREEAQQTKEEAMRLSKELNIGPTGFMKAGEAALKMGLSADKVSKLMELSGSVHIQDREISQGKATEFLGTAGILFKAGQEGRSYAEDVTRLANQWLGVANMTRTSASRIEEGLRQFAPLYASFGEDFATTTSLIGAMVQAGQTDVESGTALKSLGVRLLNPTREGREGFLISNINRADFMDFQAVSANKAFQSLMQLTDVKVSAKDRASLRAMLVEGQEKKQFIDPDFQQSLLQKYNAATGAATQEKSDANAERILMAILTAGGRIKMGEYIKILAAKSASGEMTDASLAKIGEGRHLSKNKALLGMVPEFKKLYAALKDINDEFTRSGNTIWKDSDAGKWEGTIASLDRALQRLRESAGIRSVIESLESLANKVAGLSPGVVEFGGKMAAAAVGLTAFGMAARGVGAGLGLLAAAFASPLMRKLMLGGGLAMMLGDPGDLFKANSYDPFGTPVSPAGAMWSELSTMLGNIASLATQAVSSMRQLMGMEGLSADTNPLVMLAMAITNHMRNVNAEIEKLRANISADGWLSGGAKFLAGDYEKNPGAIDWIWSKLKAAGQGMAIEKMPLINGQEAYGPPRSLYVEGQVGGKMDVNVTVKVDGNGQVTSQTSSGGEVSGRLNSGKSMPDVGYRP